MNDSLLHSALAFWSHWFQKESAKKMTFRLSSSHKNKIVFNSPNLTGCQQLTLELSLRCTKCSRAAAPPGGHSAAHASHPPQPDTQHCACFTNSTIPAKKLLKFTPSHKVSHLLVQCSLIIWLSLTQIKVHGIFGKVNHGGGGIMIWRCQRS